MQLYLEQLQASFLVPAAGPVAHPATANGEAGAEGEGESEDEDGDAAGHEDAAAPEDAARRYWGLLEWWDGHIVW